MRSQFLPQVNGVSDTELSRCQSNIDGFMRLRSEALASGDRERATSLTVAIVGQQLAKGSRSPYSPVRTLQQLAQEHAVEVSNRGFGHADMLTGEVLGEMVRT